MKRQIFAVSLTLLLSAAHFTFAQAQAQDVAAGHQRAQQFVQSKQYKSAIEEYQKILTAEPRDMRALYNMACMYSLLNDKPKALESLKKAVDAGWEDGDHIASDSDFQAIRDEAAFKEILKRLGSSIVKAPTQGTPPNFEEDAKRIIIKPLQGRGASSGAAQKAWKQINESNAQVLKNIYDICGLALPANKRVDVYFKDQPGNTRPGQIVYAVTYPAGYGSYMDVSLPIMLRRGQNYMHIYQHELTHAIQQCIMGNSAYWSRVLHEWIREGLATYVGGHGPERIAKFGKGGHTGFINGLESHKGPADYAENYLAFLYMEKNWGRGGVISFVQSVTYKRTPWKTAIKNLSGKDWSSFQSDVRSFSIAYVKEQLGPKQVARQAPPPVAKPSPPPASAAPATQPKLPTTAQTNPTSRLNNPTTVPSFVNTPRAPRAAPVGKPYFGAHLGDLDEETAQTFNLENGVIILAIRSGTPADTAGFDGGDVILRFNGIAVQNASQFNSIIAASKPGAVVEVELNREGQPMTLQVTIGSQP